MINNDASAEITAVAHNAAGHIISSAKTVNLRCVYITSPEAGADLPNDGSIDIDDSALKELDYAIAGIHSNFKMPKEQMTERIIRVIKNPYINIIAHPTGRLLGVRA